MGRYLARQAESQVPCSRAVLGWLVWWLRRRGAEPWGKEPGRDVEGKEGVVEFPIGKTQERGTACRAVAGRMGWPAAGKKEKHGSGRRYKADVPFLCQTTTDGHPVKESQSSRCNAQSPAEGGSCASDVEPRPASISGIASQITAPAAGLCNVNHAEPRGGAAHGPDLSPLGVAYRT